MLETKQNNHLIFVHSSENWLGVRLMSSDSYGKYGRKRSNPSDSKPSAKRLKSIRENDFMTEDSITDQVS